MERCDRRVDWVENGETKSYVFEKAESSAHDVEALGPPEDFYWVGDDMSRLVLYSWPEGQGVRDVANLDENYGPTIAAEIPWAGENRSYDIPEYCENVCGTSAYGVDEKIFVDDPGCEICSSFRRVRNVDLGFCSIRLPYGVEHLSENPVYELLKIDDLAFGDAIRDAIIEEINSTEESTGGLCDYDFLQFDCFLQRIKRDAELRTSSERVNWWVSTHDERDELCFRTEFDLRIDRAFGNCDWKWVRVTFCGRPELNGDGEFIWHNSRVESDWEGGGFFGNVCREGREFAADTLVNMVGEPNHDENVLSQALRLELASKLKVTKQTLLDATDSLGALGQVAARWIRDEIPSCYATLFHDGNFSGAGRRCENGLGDLIGRAQLSGLFPGNIDVDTILDEVEGRCGDLEFIHEFDGNLLYQGECEWGLEVKRLEHLPSGLELVLAENPNSLIPVLGTLSDVIGKGICAAPEEDENGRYRRVERDADVTVVRFDEPWSEPK